jgi:hypothetical protein
MTNRQEPSLDPTPGASKARMPPPIWWEQLRTWLRERPPTPAIRAYNTSFFRTRAALASAIVAMAIVGFLVFLPYALYRNYPSLIDAGSVINLYVAIGTGLLGAAALVTVYFQAVDRTADRAPNLELEARFMDHNGKPAPMVQGEFLPLESTVITMEITNVGPGVARDVWYFSVPPTPGQRGDSGDEADTNLLSRVPLRRFLRVGEGQSLPGILKANHSEARLGDSTGHRSVLVVGCDDLDGKLGDVEIIAFETQDSPVVVALLSPAEAEAALWDLTKGYSDLWWRRMGFFMPAGGLRTGPRRGGDA